jgi:DNA-binding beta-propeller fold protein YncE
MRRLLALFALALLVAVPAGCGSKFTLPNEVARDRAIPSDKSYQMLATWTGMNGVADILLTQGTGSQLFILFNTGGSGAVRGDVKAFPLTRPTPLTSFVFRTLFNPVALCGGGDGVDLNSDRRVFVLDQGDTCLARRNPTTGVCGDTTGRFTGRVTHLEDYWRVREYRLLAGDTVSTFTDTTLAFVRGIAADRQGRVYVAGSAIVEIPSQADPNFRERVFSYRVYRYVRGGPADPNMPGAAWRRDPTWEVEQGSGIGSLEDPHGIFWGPAGGGALYAADFGKNWVQKLSDTQSSTGFYFLDGGQTDALFRGVEDVTADVQGFVYVADAGNRRVLRFDPDGIYVQRVDVEPNSAGNPLINPVAVAADDSLVYVADRDAAQVIRYKRRP